jgi:type I restriction enzyme M protein
MDSFDTAVSNIFESFEAFGKAIKTVKSLDSSACSTFAGSMSEFVDVNKAYRSDSTAVIKEIQVSQKQFCKTLPSSNDKQHTAAEAFEPIAGRIKGLLKQIELLYKLAARVIESAGTLAANNDLAQSYDRRAVGRLLKELDAARTDAAEQLKQAVYFYKQIVWLQHRFPKAELQGVPGLVKLVSRKEIEAADYSLTPGRYVGVAPQEEDDDFDFRESFEEIHDELAALNTQAVKLAKQIAANAQSLLENMADD